MEIVDQERNQAPAQVRADAIRRQAQLRQKEQEMERLAIAAKAARSKDMDGLAKAANEARSPAMQKGLAALSERSRNPQMIEEVPSANEWLGGVLPSPNQAVRNFTDNIFGDDDPTTMNRGEAIGAALNKAGEAMTLGLVGDETAGRFDSLMGRGDTKDRTQFYRDQERQLWDQHPGTALTAEIGGALIGPGKGAGQLINAAKSTAGRVGRGAVAGGTSGAIYGFAEGEGSTADRASDAAMSGGIGLAGGAAVSGLAQGFSNVVNRLRGHPSAAEAIPTVDGLRQAAERLYAKAANKGGKVSEGRIKALGKVSERIAVKEGFDRDLHPRVAAVLRRLSEEAGEKSLPEMEILRRVASNAAASLQPDERRIAMKLVNQIDKAAERAGGSGEARQLWARMRKLETIEEAIDKASTYKNLESGLQNVFRTMVRNPKKLRGFSESERKAIRQIASGSNSQRAFAALGELLKLNSISGASITGAALFSSGPFGAAVPVLGYGSRKAAGAMTRNSAERARRLFASGGELPSIATAPGHALSVAPGILNGGQ